MGRRFTSASNERIHVGSTGLNGLNWLFGTVAVVASRASTGSPQTFLATNAGSGACIDFYIKDAAGAVELWDGTNTQVPTGIALGTLNSPFLIALTKATGSVQYRFHVYKFATQTWQHVDGTGTAAPNAATNTSLTIGTFADGSNEPYNGEMWAIGMWPSIVMSDSEVERLARGRWLESSPDFYEQWTDGREVGDMVRTLGRKPSRQTARTGTTRGVLPPPSGFRFGPVRRRR